MYIFQIFLGGLLLNAALGAPAASTTTNPKVVCYYGSWSVYRNGIGKFDVENIDTNLCTHIIYTFAGLDESSSKIKVLDPWNDLPDNWGKNAYGRFTGLKAQNPELKTLLAIGGWNEGSMKYSKMAANPEKRAVFIQSAVGLLLKHNFDGLDMDWEYPALRGGVPEDKNNFSILLKELKKAFSSHGLLLSAAVGMGPTTIASAYDVPSIAESLDFINLMTYDFHGAWEKQTGHNTPLSVRPAETGEWRLFNLESSVSTWLTLGAPAHKLVLGLATYGRTFTLADVTSTGLDAPTTGGGKAGRYTQQQGILGYYEICSTIGDWDMFFDKDVAAPWAVKGNQWIGFDDAESITTKSKWGKSLGLGGAMIWSLETDDFRNICGQGSFPLLSAINKVWKQGNPELPTTTSAPQNITDISSSHTSIGSSSTQNVNSSITPPTHSTTIDPASDLVTNSPVHNSTTQSSSTTEHPEKTTISNIACTKEGYFAMLQDCSKFCFCGKSENGWIRYNFNCPNGLYFNPSILTCDWPYNVPSCQ
ncbi:unnamed protein product [Meganyctiphanes norvegica]|uniref:Chitinase n=1 Tax=Meganyctiphanes norvegica TaxID=48144 RepID=A0AAV2QR45_MEGNR